MLDRAATLRSLIEYQLPIEPTVTQLHQLNWDVDTAYATITSEDFSKILERFRNKEITAEEVHYWAELIECREDIDFEAGHEELLSEYIFHLANPDLWGIVSDTVANKMQAELSI